MKMEQLQYIKRLPATYAKKIGMRDFVSKVLEVRGSGYLDCRDDVLWSSILKHGGYLALKGTPYGGATSYWDETAVPMYAAAMIAYEKYLCTDGVIRCVKDAESDALFEELKAKFTDEYWRRIDDSCKARGMIYDENEYCWVNLKTGEKVYY